MKPLSQLLSGTKDFFYYELSKPALDLYFSPRKVLIKEANFTKTLDQKDPKKLQARCTLLKQLYTFFFDKFPMCALEHYYEQKRQEKERCFLFAPDSKQPFFQYHIKYIRADDDETHDSDFLVDKLFDFYLKVCGQLRIISSFLMYWAFKRKILTPKYLS
jgi:hypothetical protein